MAKKIELKFPDDATMRSNHVDKDTVIGYEVKALVVFQATKLWRVAHINTLSPTLGSFEGWKTKKQAMAFAEEIQKHGLNWMVQDAAEFQAKNSSDLMVTAYKAAMEKSNANS